jgi:hypothetical protein
MSINKSLLCNEDLISSVNRRIVHQHKVVELNAKIPMHNWDMISINPIKFGLTRQIANHSRGQIYCTIKRGQMLLRWFHGCPW